MSVAALQNGGKGGALARRVCSAGAREGAGATRQRLTAALCTAVGGSSAG